MPLPLLKYDIATGVEAFSTRRDSVLPCHVITGHQVHGCKVAVVERGDLTREDLTGYDALVTNLLGVSIGVRTADCVPILMYDPVQKAVAAVHSGWKGTVLRIAEKAINVMCQRYGTRAEDLRVAIGPAIGPDSFQVGEDVVRYFKEQGFPLDEIWSFRKAIPGKPMSGGHHIDLISANRWLLESVGVQPGSILSVDIDTYTDEEFFSARREGTQCGRTINAIGIYPPSPLSPSAD